MRGLSRIPSTSEESFLNVEKEMRKTRTAMMMFAMVCVLSWVAAAEEGTIHKKELPEVSTAETPSLSTTVSACFMSKYIWRGQLIDDDYAFQPSVGLSYGGLSASLWGNLDMTDYHDNSGEFTEYDWTIGYAGKFPGIDILKYSVGVIYYHFPSSTLNTTEIYGGLGLDIPLSPTVTVYRDVDEYKGTYAAFSLSHSVEKIFELSPDMPVGLTASASIGWGNKAYNRGYWGGLDENALNDLTLALGFPMPVLGWTFTPSVNYVTLLDSDVRKADTYASRSDYFFTGLTLSKSF
jgi:hypothetical protein